MRNKLQLAALYPVVGVAVPGQTAAAFQELFGLEPVFESDWYVHVKSPDHKTQLGLVRYDHASVPAPARRSVVGSAVFVTIEIADVASVWSDLKSQLDVVVPLTDEEWGQRHFICRLPGDVLVDAVQMLPRAD